MKMQFLTSAVCLVLMSLLSVKAIADGNVTTMVEPGGSTLYIIADNNDNEIRISSLYGGATLLVEGLNGTTINGDWDEYDHPGFQYENVVVELRDGNDVLEIDNLNMGDDRFDVFQDGGDATITLTNSVLSSSKIITGRGRDSVSVVKVEAVHLRISDAEGAYPFNVAMPSTSSSIMVSDTQIKCLDLQAHSVSVNNQHGALVAAATIVDINEVDSATGDVQIGIWPGFQVAMEPSSVVVAAEYDSAESDIEISSVRTAELSVLYYDTFLNDRPASKDNILISEIVADEVVVATGMGSDRLQMQNVDAGNDVYVDLGSESDRRNLDGTNVAMVYNVNCGDDCEVVGGSGNDYVYVHSVSAMDSLTINTMFGADTVRLYYADVVKDTDISLGAGNDNLKSYGSMLSGLRIDGGFGLDRAFQVHSTWGNLTLEAVEYSNF